MAPWRQDAGVRRRAVFALALLAHGVLVVAMLSERVRHAGPDADSTAEATIVLQPPRQANAAPAAARVTRLRAIPHAAVEPRTIEAPLLEPRPIALAASAPAPVASAASAPLNLTLTRDQLRAIVAGVRPTLAQSLAKLAAPSALASIAGDDAPYEEKPLPGGVTEVHVHGGCFRLVPTSRAQYDPFNHANERLTAGCK
jgi:hypothetical protein